MWNEQRYLDKKQKVTYDLSCENKKPFDFMMEYKACIMLEDYEHAKAITECLEPLNYVTSDTHIHIDVLKRTIK